MARFSFSEIPSYTGLHFVLSQVEENSQVDQLDINDMLDEDLQLEVLERDTLEVEAYINALEESEND